MLFAGDREREQGMQISALMDRQKESRLNNSQVTHASSTHCTALHAGLSAYSKAIPVFSPACSQQCSQHAVGSNVQMMRRAIPCLSDSQAMP